MGRTEDVDDVWGGVVLRVYCMKLDGGEGFDSKGCGDGAFFDNDASVVDDGRRFRG